MPKRLDELSSPRIDAMQTHPVHGEGIGTVIRLINRLRSCETDADLYDMQQELLAAVLAVEEHRQGCSRVVKRFRAGKGVPADAVELRGHGNPNESDAWEIERALNESPVSCGRSVTRSPGGRSGTNVTSSWSCPATNRPAQWLARRV